jgi:hypothetical protein
MHFQFGDGIPEAEYQPCSMATIIHTVLNDHKIDCTEELPGELVAFISALSLYCDEIGMDSGGNVANFEAECSKRLALALEPLLHGSGTEALLCTALTPVLGEISASCDAHAVATQIEEIRLERRLKLHIAENPTQYKLHEQLYTS